MKCSSQRPSLLSLFVYSIRVIPTFPPSVITSIYVCVCSLARQKRVPLSANEGSRRERERESGERARALSSNAVSSSEMEEIESADLDWRYSIPAVVGLCAPFTRRHSPLWVCPRSLRVLSLVADAKCLLIPLDVHRRLPTPVRLFDWGRVK